MTIKEVWDNLGGKEGIERLERTPAGVLIHLKKEEPVTMESGDGLEAVQDGKTLELLLSKEKKLLPLRRTILVTMPPLSVMSI